jgi:hypothetical protein
MQFNRLSGLRAVFADTALPGVERVHLDAEYQRLRLESARSWNPG